jgi:hypothetical protein
MHPLWPTFIVFGFVLLLAHLPVLRVKWGRNGVIADKDRWARNCERSDYLYLALAAVALIPATRDVHRFLRSQELRAFIRRDVLLEELAAAISTQGPENKLPPAIGLSPPPEVVSYNRTVDLSARRAVEDLHKAKVLLLSGRVEEADSYLEQAQQRFVKIVGTPVPRYGDSPRASKEYADGELQKIQDIRRRCAALQRDRLESSLFALGPYLLAVGLAIRFAKASAKLQLELQKVYEKAALDNSHCEAPANPPVTNSGEPVLIPAEIVTGASARYGSVFAGSNHEHQADVGDAQEAVSPDQPARMHE